MAESVSNNPGVGPRPSEDKPGKERRRAVSAERYVEEARRSQAQPQPAEASLGYCSRSEPQAPRPPAALAGFEPRHEHFVGIDSDGCVFDSMELKHKECFIPQTIKHYELQAVSKHAREVWEFVNLYSTWRGTNRFPGLVLTHDLLAERPEVARRQVTLKSMEPLRRFVGSGAPLGNPALASEVARTGDPDLRLALSWSEDVNRAVAEIARGLRPFPCARECLEKISAFADAMCVSATPVAALKAEWEESDIARHVAVIAGQETGSKAAMLGSAAAAGYQPGRLLMVGDAPGDLKAARAAGALFYPVIPGEEERSWERLLEEALDRFREGRYAGAYEEGLVQHFLSQLPSTPPWKKKEPE
jgi:phosphoglycolate phosphatase-like HAD superfamily hydrolase